MKLKKRYNRKPNCACFVCSKEVYRRPAQQVQGRIYCSQACCGNDQQKNNKECPVCGTRFNRKGKTCSRKCSNTQRAGIKYGKPNYVYMTKSMARKVSLANERGGICEECGEDNFAILETHHIIERCNGGTDDPTNLKLLCPSCHRKSHFGQFTFEEYLSMPATGVTGSKPKSFATIDLPSSTISTIAAQTMDPRHDHLNDLL